MFRCASTPACPRRTRIPSGIGSGSAGCSECGIKGIVTTFRPLQYVRVAHGTGGSIEVAHEKGIDIRIALDVVRLASTGALDVAVLFAQDQDYAEVAREVREVAERKNRWIKIASAFPESPSATSRRGVDRTDWKPFDRDLYDRCLDSADYFV